MAKKSQAKNQHGYTYSQSEIEKCNCFFHIFIFLNILAIQTFLDGNPQECSTTPGVFID